MLVFILVGGYWNIKNKIEAWVQLKSRQVNICFKGAVLSTQLVFYAVKFTSKFMVGFSLAVSIKERALCMPWLDGTWALENL